MNDVPPTAVNLDLLQCQVASLEQLLEVQEQTVIEQSRRLEGALAELQAEREALSKSEAQIRLVIEAALDAVISVDMDGAVEEWNAQAEETFGWSREEAVGRINIANLIVQGKHPDAQQRDMKRFLATHAYPGLNERVELTAMDRHGREFPIELSMSPISIGGKTILSAFVRDITVRKQQEEALARARDEALTASRLKSEFLATMSHEIRTPMNGVIGMTELLLETDLTPEQVDYAKTIEGSANALLTILNDILDFSKIEAGRLSLESIPFDLRQVVEEMGELLAPGAAQKNLELIVRYAPEAPRHLLGDPGRIRQILANLTVNAIKFTERGHVFIDVEAEEQSETAVRLCLSVQDTGIGIAGNKLKQIFEKFTQADASTTRKYGGTGLGLAITSHLAELMGGAVSVQSQLGAGSTFTVTLPFARDTQAPALPAQLGRWAGLRALIVDDNDISRRVLQEQLNSAHLSTCSVAGAGEALPALRQAKQAGQPFHLALIDDQMPGIDGETLARQIRTDPDLRELVLVAVTSAGRSGSARAPGYTASLTKPVCSAHLHRVLEEARVPESTDLTKLSGAVELSAPKRPQVANVSQRARVLLAEDNLVNQRVATRMLERLGCRVDIASSGREAAAKAGTNAYDLVFMDCHMPDGDGYEATAAIRRQEADHRTPIVAMTANAMRGDRQRCLAAGMDDYISKPISSAELSRALDCWLSPAASGRLALI